MPAPPAARRSRIERRCDRSGSLSAMCPWTAAPALVCASMTPLRIRAFAPGRVNLIGEHTDYNLGLCLPFAVEPGVTVTAELRDGGQIVAPGLPDDDPYLRGAIAELRAAGVEPPGSTIAVDSDLPQEAGLSSS